MRHLLLVCGLLVLAACNGSGTTSVPATSSAATFKSAFPALNFQAPLYLTAVPGGNRLAVVTQEGVIIYV